MFAGDADDTVMLHCRCVRENTEGEDVFREAGEWSTASSSSSDDG